MSVNVPLSAFAARKPKKPPSEDAAKSLIANESGDSSLSLHLNALEEEQPRRPQKRKREARPAASYKTRILSQRERGTKPITDVSGAVEANNLRRSVSSFPSTSCCSVNAAAPEACELWTGGSDVSGGRDSSCDAEVLSSNTDPVRHFSSFSPTEHNVLEDTKEEWTIRLKEHDTVAIVGQYDLWVRRGAVTIMGAMLHASPKLHRVYAPSTHSLPLMQYARDPYGPVHQPVEITILSCRNQLRLLRRLSWRFARIWNSKTQPSIAGQSSAKRSFSHLATSADDPLKRPLYPLDIRADWQSLLTELAIIESPIPLAVMICGPKNSGKSTFTRYLANSILMRAARRVRSQNVAHDHGVALLDLDPGQPEFSPPGEISLLHLRSCNFGPAYAHPVLPPGSRLVRAHHVGVISPKENPDHYLECVLDLVLQYRRMLANHSSCPLIVNCSGWVLGSGLEVLVELIKKVRLTAVVYMSTTGPTEVLDTLVQASGETRTPVHTLSSQPTEVATRTAADFRAMQTLSYFHHDEPEEENFRWNARPLAEIPPLVVKYAGVKQVIFGVMILGEMLDLDSLATVLDGSVVGVVAIEDDSALTLKERRPWSGSAERILDEDVKDGLGLDYDMAHDHFSPAQVAGADRDPSDTQIGQDHEQTSDDSCYEHPNIHRTTGENLPYFTAANGACTPLDPSRSRSLGQALVRYIDKDSQCLHLLTPIHLDTILSVHRRKEKIVLVRGKLDTPTWAYQEYLPRMRKLMELAGKVDLLEWAKDFPWMKEAMEKNDKQKGDKVWRVRRNLKTHGSGTDGAVSE